MKRWKCMRSPPMLPNFKRLRNNLTEEYMFHVCANTKQNNCITMNYHISKNKQIWKIYWELESNQFVFFKLFLAPLLLPTLTRWKTCASGKKRFNRILTSCWRSRFSTLIRNFSSFSKFLDFPSFPIWDSKAKKDWSRKNPADIKSASAGTEDSKTSAHVSNQVGNWYRRLKNLCQYLTPGW